MGITWSLVKLGWTLLALDEDEQATAHLEESLTRSREEGTAGASPLRSAIWAGRPTGTGSTSGQRPCTRRRWRGSARELSLGHRLGVDRSGVCGAGAE